MNFSSYLTTSNSSCFFELSGDGRVLHSRFRHGSGSVNADAEFVGHNFFEEIAGFENVKEFRRVFNNFVESREFTNSFVFECRCDGKLVPVRIMLVRIFGKTDFEVERRIILDIRNNC